MPAMDSSSLADHSYAIQARFAHALYIVHSMFSKGELEITEAGNLGLRCLERQALEGDCADPQPHPHDRERYAEWDEWNRLKGLRPVEAQRLYVDEVCDILSKCYETYPDQPQAAELCETLHYLSSFDTSTVDEQRELFVDALDGTDPDQQDGNQSPGQSALTGSSASTGDFPLTPELPSYIQQDTKHNACLRQQQPQHDSICTQSARSPFHYTLSDTDTIDREISATTPNLRLTSLHHKPYYYASLPHYNANKPAQHESLPIRHSRNRCQTGQSNVSSERVLESLQTDITALSEQVDHLRRFMNSKEEQKRRLRWTWLWLAKTVAKHAVVNLLILFLVFLVLWRRRSPIAYAIIGFVGPQMQDIVYYLARRIVFWKVTV